MIRELASYACRGFAGVAKGQRVVVALGGNALLRRGEPLTMENQLVNVKVAADHLSGVAADYEFVLTHGNGPQVGLLSLQADSYKEVPPPSLDLLGAQSQALIGQMIGQEMTNRLSDKVVATIVTQVLVDPSDSAYQDPTKFVGPVYTKKEAFQLAEDEGWSIKQDGKDDDVWRRVVPSPLPIDIIEISAIRTLLEAGLLVIACGGGGVPVVLDEDTGFLSGSEAVIDKDRCGSLLAQLLDADGYIIATDGGGGVIPNFGSPGAREMQVTNCEELKKYEFPGGSMGPKVEAAIDFVEGRGGDAWAIIGDLNDCAELFEGTKGTLINLTAEETIWYDE